MNDLYVVKRIFSVLLEVPNIRQTGKDDNYAEEGVIIIGDICIVPANGTKKTLKGTVPAKIWEVIDETGETVGEPHRSIDDAAIAALQHYVKSAAKGILDELVCEGAAAWFEEEKEMLKKAYREGLAASNLKEKPENPYGYGIQHAREWEKGYKAGQELNELTKPY